MTNTTTIAADLALALNRRTGSLVHVDTQGALSVLEMDAETAAVAMSTANKAGFTANALGFDFEGPTGRHQWLTRMVLTGKQTRDMLAAL